MSLIENQLHAWIIGYDTYRHFERSVELIFVVTPMTVIRVSPSNNRYMDCYPVRVNSVIQRQFNHQIQEMFQDD